MVRDSTTFRSVYALPKSPCHAWSCAVRLWWAADASRSAGTWFIRQAPLAIDDRRTFLTWGGSASDRRAADHVAPTCLLEHRLKRYRRGSQRVKAHGPTM